MAKLRQRSPDEVLPAGAGLQNAELEYLLRKPVNTLAIVPKSEKITLTARKIYNVMLHHAQKQGVAQDIYRVQFKAIALTVCSLI